MKKFVFFLVKPQAEYPRKGKVCEGLTIATLTLVITCNVNVP